MLSPTSVSKNGMSIYKLLAAIPVFLVIVFLVIGLLSNSFMKRLVFIDQIHKTISSISSEQFLELMSWENPYFTKELPKEYKRLSFSRIALQTVTDINIEDERSLLGNELPGFALFDTNIVVRGEGTNFTNMPNDTPPSIDYVLKQQQQDLAGNQPKSGGGGSDNPGSSNPTNSDVKGAQVLIYSTHTWENYLPLIGKTGDPDANHAVGPGTPSQGVHLVDTWLKDDLTQIGIPTDVNYQNAATVLNAKGWNTNQAYDASRPIVEDAINSGKPYKLIIDIHRDSARKKITTAQINNKPYARIDIIVGTADPHYDKNNALAQKLNKDLEKTYPGISRGIFSKGKSEGNGVYNQDLSTHAILLEIGGVDNNETELKNTCEALSNVLKSYVQTGN